MALAMPQRTYPPPFDDEELRKSARRMIRRQGVPRADVDDVIQLVAMAVSVCTTLPSKEPDRTKYLFGMTRNIAIDFANGVRKRVDRVPRGDTIPRVPGPRGPSLETLDFARRVQAVAAERDPQAAEWAVRSTMEGEDQTVIAEEAGVPVNRVRKRIERLFRWVRNNTDKLALVALVVGLAGVWTWLRQRETGVASPRPEQEAESQKDRAERIRSKAASECAAKMWHDCLDSLDRARDIDPAGDSEPRVDDMRREAEAALAREPSPVPSGKH
jgi:DNA-directed RNA polymerase specialized sigma24 family protein